MALLGDYTRPRTALQRQNALSASNSDHSSAQKLASLANADCTISNTHIATCALQLAHLSEPETQILKFPLLINLLFHSVYLFSYKTLNINCLKHYHINILYIKIWYLYDVMPCCQVEGHQNFKGICCHHLASTRHFCSY